VIVGRTTSRQEMPYCLRSRSAAAMVLALAGEWPMHGGHPTTTSGRSFSAPPQTVAA